MTNFAQARQNMVDGQIHPNGIIIPELLTAYETVPRELFVPANLQNIAYSDEDLDVGHGRFVLEPISHARMVQALEPKPNDVVLDVGGTMGYSAAILSKLVSTVIAQEDNKDFLESAAKTWDALDLYNISGVQNVLYNGCPDHAPYDAIFLNGAVHELPEHLIEQLRPEGRLVCVIRKDPSYIGQATLVQSQGGKKYSSMTLFDVGCPYLHGFEPKPVFEF